MDDTGCTLLTLNTKNQSTRKQMHPNADFKKTLYNDLGVCNSAKTSPLITRQEITDTKHIIVIVVLMTTSLRFRPNSFRLGPTLSNIYEK